MKVVFIVQGEGRGHLTQALSLEQILRRAGHEVSAVLAGHARGRQLPDFFVRQMPAPVHPLLSPHLVYDPAGGGVSLNRTLRTHLWRFGKYAASLRTIRAVVEQTHPDLIVNFYEVLGGLYKLTHPSSPPMVCVAHQYLLLHPQFPFPKNGRFDRLAVCLNTRLTALGASRKLALSFRRFDQAAPIRGLTVVPPLLRTELRGLRPTSCGFVLAYLTHPSLRHQIEGWHASHPALPLHCFWNNPDAPEVLRVDGTLTFHRLDGPKYLRMMAACRALVTTAGFESVCEAMYLGKPVMMVPVPRHFEQACNAIDGVRAGAGVAAATFDLSVLTDFLPRFQSTRRSFTEWCHASDHLFVKYLEEAVVESGQLAAPRSAPAEFSLS